MKARETLAAIPYARYLGLTVEEEAGGLIAILPFRDDLVGNPAVPALHGGVVGAFLELTALLQVMELVDSARVPKPINFSIDYLRSAGPRVTRGRAEIVKHGRRVVNVRVLAWQDDPHKPVAAGIGNFLL